MTKQRALANQEREIQAKRLSRFAKASLLTVATVMTFATISLLVADNLYRPDSFVIDQLKIKGKFKNMTAEDVQTAVHDGELGNFFSIDLVEIKQRVESLPWVQRADVRREWPHTLTVTVREHRPVMRWQSVDIDPKSKPRSKHQWVSAAGDIVSLDNALESDAITLRGLDHDAALMLRKAAIWSKALARSGLSVKELSLSASRAWALELVYTDSISSEDVKFELLLGREQAEERLKRFRFLFDKQFRQADQHLIRVDARYPDGLAVQAQKVMRAEDDGGVSTRHRVANFSNNVLAKLETAGLATNPFDIDY